MLGIKSSECTRVRTIWELLADMAIIWAACSCLPASILPYTTSMAFSCPNSLQSMNFCPTCWTRCELPFGMCGIGRTVFLPLQHNILPWVSTLHFSNVFAHQSSSHKIAFLIFSLSRNPWPSPSISTSLTSPPCSLMILSMSLA